MAEESPGLHIDTDWKKQAQEEKRKLAEEEARRAAPPAAAPTPPAGATPPPGPGVAPRAGQAGREQREAPAASMSMLIQSLMTQSLYYLGDLAPRGAAPSVNLDMAKQNVDLLGVIEEKTRGNLTPEEQQLLDTALYEVRMRFVSVASQYIS